MPNTIGNSLSQTIEHFRAFVAENETSTPDDAVKSSFQRSHGVSPWYMAYRWVQFAAHFLIYLASFLDFKRSWMPTYTSPNTVYRGAKFYAKWFLYLTHWGVFLNMVQALLGAVIVTVAFKNSNLDSMPLKFVTFYKYTFGVALNLSLWITVGFWSLIYDSSHFRFDLVTATQHGLCTYLLLLDLVVVKFPYKLFTGVWTCVVGSVYEMILLGHFLLGALDRYQDRPYLYEVQDWNRPLGATIVTFSAVLTVISFNFLLWGLYQVKRHFIEVHYTNSN